MGTDYNEKKEKETGQTRQSSATHNGSLTHIGYDNPLVSSPLCTHQRVTHLNCLRVQPTALQAARHNGRGFRRYLFGPTASQTHLLIFLGI